jgi:rRNA small subunit pseudouridine methyltransferase Nep1
LIEQLFLEKRVPLEGDPLLTLQKTTLQQFIKKRNPSTTIGLSRIGEPELLRNVADSTAKASHPIVIIGAFPRGHFTEDTRRLLNEIHSVDKRSLDTWIVAGRFVYDFEWSIGIAQKRIESKQ